MKISKILILCLFIVGIGIIVILGINRNAKYNSYLPTCLESKHYDSDAFGRALAVNDNYLAVGDPQANRVVIYQRQTNGDWLRNKEITPPETSNSRKIGLGFGADLFLNGNTLVIRSGNGRWRKGNSIDEFYLTSINTDSSLVKIEYPAVDSMPVSSVSFLKKDIALATRTKIDSHQWRNRIYIVDAQNGKTIKVIEPVELQYVDDSQGNVSNIHLYSYQDSLMVIDNFAYSEDIVYLISTDGKLKKTSLNRQKSKDKKWSTCFLQSFSVSNELIATSCLNFNFSPFGVSIFSQFPQPSSLADYYFSGVVDTKQEYVLLSYRFVPDITDFDYPGPHHELMRLKNNKIDLKTFISWQNHPLHKYRPVQYTTGVIGERDLFVSAGDGRVVRLPIENLPSSFQIDQSICGKQL